MPAARGVKWPVPLSCPELGGARGTWEQLTLTLTQPPRREMRLCSRAPAVSAHRADGRASPVRIRTAGSCALSWKAYPLELKSSRLDETPEVGGTQPRRGLARPERRELS